MNSQTSISRAQLEHAEALLRDVLLADFQRDAKGDAVSLGRMLVHIVNIHRAVSIYTDRHANAAKRLGDFAAATSRMTVRNPASATKLGRLVKAFRAASLGLRDGPGSTAAASSLGAVPLAGG